MPGSWNWPAQQPGGGEPGQQPVALGIDVGSDVVGDLTGQVAEAAVAVVARRTEPERAAVLGTVGQPPADMMAVVGAVADLLLEGEILLAAEQVERAHRGVGIGAAEQHAGGDADRAARR